MVPSSPRGNNYKTGGAIIRQAGGGRPRVRWAGRGRPNGPGESGGPQALGQEPGHECAPAADLV